MFYNVNQNATVAPLPLPINWTQLKCETFHLGFFFTALSQRHGHSHYQGADHYSASHQDVEEGEKEKLQQNGEASSRALVKVDAGEGELMLSPAQMPQVGNR